MGGRAEAAVGPLWDTPSESHMQSAPWPGEDPGERGLGPGPLSDYGLYRSHLCLATWRYPRGGRGKMEEIIAGLERFTFAFEQDVELQKGTGLLPFQGMNSEW